MANGTGLAGMTPEFMYQGIDPATGSTMFGTDPAAFLPGSITGAASGTNTWGSLGQDNMLDNILGNLATPMGNGGLAGMSPFELGLGAFNIWNNWRAQNLQKDAYNKQIENMNWKGGAIADQYNNALRRGASIDKQLTGGLAQDSRKYMKAPNIGKL